MKDYERCIETTLQAIEIGVENRADFTMRAKSYARVARAYHAQGKVCLLCYGLVLISFIPAIELCAVCLRCGDTESA